MVEYFTVHHHDCILYYNPLRNNWKIPSFDLNQNVTIYAKRCSIDSTINNKARKSSGLHRKVQMQGTFGPSLNYSINLRYNKNPRTSLRKSETSPRPTLFSSAVSTSSFLLPGTCTTCIVLLRCGHNLDPQDPIGKVTVIECECECSRG